jgi:hypothetical protein
MFGALVETAAGILRRKGSVFRAVLMSELNRFHFSDEELCAELQPEHHQ